MSLRYIGILLVALVLSGCDLEKLGAEVAKSTDLKEPKIMLGSGITLQISETETARVYGPDKCPTHEMPEWLFGPAIETDGCTMLSGNKSVEVLLVRDSSHFNERWTVSEGIGKYETGISLTRPNGWVLREPKK